MGWMDGRHHHRIGLHFPTNFLAQRAFYATYRNGSFSRWIFRSVIVVGVAKGPNHDVTSLLCCEQVVRQSCLWASRAVEYRYFVLALVGPT
jgi:hypothetical protein